MSIWLIQESYWRDTYNGDYREEVPDTEVGYFPTLEAAQAYCDEKNNYKRKAYDEYLAKIEQQAVAYKKMYAKAIKRYAVLCAAGFTDEPEPREPVTEKVKTYEEFVAARAYGWSTYAPLEIEPFARSWGIERESQ